MLNRGSTDGADKTTEEQNLAMQIASFGRA